MSREIEALVDRYERGLLNHRQFVLAIGALAAGATVTQTESPTFEANSLNHVSIAVTDPEKSRAFYETTLGCSV